MNKQKIFLVVIVVFCSMNVHAKFLYKIPFIFSGNRIYVEGLINGQKCTLLYDTGAYGITIDKEFAENNNVKEMSLKDKSEIEISISEFNKKTLFYKVQDCKTIGSTMDMGIVGINLFEDYLVEIDYTEHVLNIYSRDEVLQGYIQLEAKWQKHIQFLGSFITNATIVLNDSTAYTGRFIIDTGSGRNITLLRHVPVKVKKDYFTWRGKNASWYGFNVSKVFKMDKFIFNKITYSGLIADYSMDENMEASTAIDGIIGGGFLRNFKIVVDYSGRAIYFKENLHIDGFVSSYTGDNVSYRNRVDDLGGLLVVSILDHPLFIHSKIKLDDIIIAVNGVSVQSKEFDKLEELFNIEGFHITYTIKRGDKIFNVENEIKKIL